VKNTGVISKRVKTKRKVINRGKVVGIAGS